MTIKKYFVFYITILSLFSSCTTMLNLPTQSISGHQAVITKSIFSPNGEYILSTSTDHSMFLWKSETGEKVRSFNNSHPHKLWEAHTSECNGHGEAINNAAFLSSGQFLISASDDKTIKFWDVNTGQVITSFEEHSDVVTSIAVSNDNKLFVSSSQDRTLKIWNFDRTTSLKTLGKHEHKIKDQDGLEIQCNEKCIGHTSYILDVTISPNNQTAISTGYKEILLWDLTTGNLLKKIEGHTDWINSVSFHPSGKYFITGAWDKQIKLWDAETLNELRKFVGHTGSIYSVAINSTGTKIISAGLDKSIRLWDINTGRLLKTYGYHPHKAYNEIGFAETCSADCVGHTDKVSSVAFSPGGNSILTSAWDKTIKLWKISD